MKIIMFSKAFREKTVDELIRLAQSYGMEGFDLCVRPEYPINPDNAASALPDAVKRLNAAELAVPMVTGNFDLLEPSHPTARPILAAMDRAGVRLLKLGYFQFDPRKQDYWQEVDRIRRLLDGWQKLSREHNVKVCYHTHSRRCMGLNCGLLMHLLGGFDPQCIGAYIDPAHMVVEGEEFPVGVAIVLQYLSIIGLKDVLLRRVEVNGHGSVAEQWVPAGEGMVDWTGVFDELARVGFDGPLSVHCEYSDLAEPLESVARRDVAFFKAHRDRVAGM
ncbi:MAG TPA: sugar phosphate isomerase/epimerase family protein [Planctomycetota bacterium]|nr:sugar phosphate isomerase/epimerase family protein [Planctomycetota bacterium]